MSSAAATTRAGEQIAFLYDPASNDTIRYDALNRPISVTSSAANGAVRRFYPRAFAFGPRA